VSHHRRVRELKSQSKSATVCSLWGWPVLVRRAVVPRRAPSGEHFRDAVLWWVNLPAITIE
jgi:hypothetical protein